MNTETLKTLEAVQDARIEIEYERSNPCLTAGEQQKLDALSLLLKGMERAMIKEAKDELVKTLTADAEKLHELVTDIQTINEKLANLALKISAAAEKVEALIKIIGIAAKVGLL